MGAYIYITEAERISMRRVLHPELKSLFEEALQCDPSLMIRDYPVRVKRGWFGYTIETKYDLYHESPSYDGSAYQARFQSSASKNMDTLVAYLHGIINGSPKTK